MPLTQSWSIMGFLKTADTCKKLKAQGLGNVTGCVAYSKVMHGCRHAGLAFFANWQPPHVSLSGIHHTAV